MAQSLTTARRLARVLDNLLADDERHQYTERVACALGAELIRMVHTDTLARAVAAVANKVTNYADI